MKRHLLLSITALFLFTIWVTGCGVQPTSHHEEIPAQAQSVESNPTQTSAEGSPTPTPPPHRTEETAVSLPTPAKESGTPTSTPATVNIELAAEAEQAIGLSRADLAQKLGLSTEDIHLISVEGTAWRDSSLGCPQPGQETQPALALGFLVILEAQGETYEYHTDLGQTAVLCEEESGAEKSLEEKIMPTSPTIPTPSDSALSQPVTQAKEDLAQRLNVAIDEIEVVEIQEVTWSDASMGCPQPGMRYKQVPQDGLLIKFSVEGQVYEYHSGGMRAPFLCEQTVKVKPTSIELDLLKMTPPPRDLGDQ